MSEEILVPLVICVSMFATLFGYVYLRSRENMALIGRGFNPRQNYPKFRTSGNLRIGMLLAGAGLGLLFAFLVSHVIPWETTKEIMYDPNPSNPVKYYTRKNDDDLPALYFGLIALGGGLGLILSYRMEKRDTLKYPEVKQAIEE